MYLKSSYLGSGNPLKIWPRKLMSLSPPHVRKKFETQMTTSPTNALCLHVHVTCWRLKVANFQFSQAEKGSIAFFNLCRQVRKRKMGILKAWRVRYMCVSRRESYNVPTEIDTTISRREKVTGKKITKGKEGEREEDKKGNKDLRDG